MILQCVFRCSCISAFFPIGWCLERPILHVGGLTRSLSIRFAPASSSYIVKRFSASVYFIIALVVGPSSCLYCMSDNQKVVCVGSNASLTLWRIYGEWAYECSSP